MFIRKFLIVSCIVSIIGVAIINLFEGKDIDLDLDDYFYDVDIMKGGLQIDYEVDFGDKNLVLERHNVVEGDDINNDDEEEVLLELYIPRISLRKFVYTIDSSKNDVDFNVELLNGSDEFLNLYFLASHSGGGRASYFDDLVYLDEGDIIWLYKHDGSLGYVVDDIFYIEKNGYFNVSYGGNGNRLFLITCSVEKSNKQLVVTAKMVYSE